ncbi:hypothetical protein Gohar_002083, partial [Gossypium harknessii]|nr:hypothetical protein [Gossypium harknessii]
MDGKLNFLHDKDFDDQIVMLK